MVAAVWGAHAPSRAGDDALVIANFSGQALPGKGTFPVPAQVHCGEGAAIGTRGRVRSPEVDPARPDFNVTARLVEQLHAQVTDEGERLVRIANLVPE